MPDGLPPSLPPPYTGHKNLTKKVQTDPEHAEWTARFLAIVDEVRGSTTIHRELAEINRLSLVELIGRGPAPCRVFAKLDRKMDKIFGEPAWKKVTAESVTYESFIDKWMDKTKNGKKKGPKAREDMERAVRRFTAWLRSKNLPHHDITQVRFENCRDYRDHLYTSDPNPDHFKTHSNHLATLKALFSRAAKGRHLPANPFADLEWDRGKENRRPDFTREERARILRLARSAEDPVIKWGNVLAALGGYRNEELADAHARDVYRKNGIWVLHIREDNRTPDQRLKTPSRTRIMPLHSAILEEGFLKFVEPVGDRPLFHHLKLYGYGRRTSEFTAIINEWLHETVGTEKTFYSHRHTVTSILRNPSGRMVALLLTGIFNAICSATAKRMCTAAMARVGSRL